MREFWTPGDHPFSSSRRLFPFWHARPSPARCSFGPFSSFPVAVCQNLFNPVPAFQARALCQICPSGRVLVGLPVTCVTLCHLFHPQSKSLILFGRKASPRTLSKVSGRPRLALVPVFRGFFVSQRLSFGRDKVLLPSHCLLFYFKLLWVPPY